MSRSKEDMEGLACDYCGRRGQLDLQRGMVICHRCAAEQAKETEEKMSIVVVATTENEKGVYDQ